MADTNRWIILGFLCLSLTAAPVLLIGLGLGWAYRGVIAIPHKITVSLQASTSR